MPRRMGEAPDGWGCRENGCDHPIKTRQMCKAHYERWRAGKDRDAPIRERTHKNIGNECLVDHCKKPARQRGLCASHYNRKLSGRSDWSEVSMYEKSQEARFWEKVDKSGGYPDFADPLMKLTKSDGECWLWTASLDEKGYGQINWSGAGVVGAHRASWFIAHGEWSRRGESSIDHRCRRTACVNPAHLELVPERWNAIRGDGPTGRNFRKTHCVNGHEFTLDNIYWENDNRKCRTCRREKARRWYLKNKEARAA